jgi:hypothetical protein
MAGWLDFCPHLDLDFVRVSREGKLAKNDVVYHKMMITFERLSPSFLFFDKSFCRVFGKDDNQMLGRKGRFCWVSMDR